MSESAAVLSSRKFSMESTHCVPCNGRDVFAPPSPHYYVVHNPPSLPFGSFAKNGLADKLRTFNVPKEPIESHVSCIGEQKCWKKA